MLTRPGADVRLLFLTRIARLFAYGALSVVLVLFLSELGLDQGRIGLLLTLTLLGDTAISLLLTTTADRLGRRRMLILGATLMLLAGVAFALASGYGLLVLAATIGVISPSGNEVGPFLAIEQAALSQAVPDVRRTRTFAWYNLAGACATAAGALAGGGLTQLLQTFGIGALASYRTVLVGYAAIGAILVVLFTRLSPAAEAPLAEVAHPLRHPISLGRSRGVVLRLSGLFAIDAFGGGFVLQSIAAYWFHVRFGAEPALLGSIFFGANLLAGLSYLAAARLAERIGLLNTMIFTHVPSNLLLMAVPFMPTLPLAIGVLLLRFAISQMDVPTRQSYTMALVPPDERSAAAGVTNVARTTGAALAPVIAGPLLASPALLNAPFVIAGALKLVYDAALYLSFRNVKER